MPKDHTDYLMTELDCLTAIERFKTTTSIPGWLDQYQKLYRDITIAPAGLPEIIDCHLEGKTFEGILKFGGLYETIKSVFSEKYVYAPNPK